MYNYNDASPLNDYKVNKEEQDKTVSQILGTQTQTKKMKRILIAIPTNRNIEAQTFKSIYDLIIPDGYQVDFQYFWGYSRVQVKNLIAEWAKNYDLTIFMKKQGTVSNSLICDIIESNSDVVIVDDSLIFSVNQTTIFKIPYPQFEPDKSELDELNNFVEKVKNVRGQVKYLRNYFTC